MGLDLRFPIGLLFVILGAILATLGLFGNPAVYQRSLGINVNLWWGLVMILFGGLMLLLFARIGKKYSQSRIQDSKDGK